MNIYLFVFETGPSGDLKVKENSLEMVRVIKPRPILYHIVPQSSRRKMLSQIFIIDFQFWAIWAVQENFDSFTKASYFWEGFSNRHSKLKCDSWNWLAKNYISVRTATYILTFKTCFTFSSRLKGEFFVTTNPTETFEGARDFRSRHTTSLFYRRKFSLSNKKSAT